MAEMIGEDFTSIRKLNSCVELVFYFFLSAFSSVERGIEGFATQNPFS